MTSWNNGTTNTAYTYDKSGNRVTAGGITFTYDERNQLLTKSGGTSYAYTKRGTLASTTTGTVVLPTQSDAFGQVITQYSTPTAHSDYTYDGLGRAIKPGFNYSGAGNDLAADGTATYTRGPGGDLLGVKAGASNTLAWTDLHNDVVGQFTATGTALTGSTTYDPWGKVLNTSGMLSNLGYQAGFTDFATGRVNMAARWYNSDTGQFDTRDAVGNSPTPGSSNANRFAYVNDNPLTGTDITGHMQDGKRNGGIDCSQTPSNPVCQEPSCTSNCNGSGGAGNGGGGGSGGPGSGTTSHDPCKGAFPDPTVCGKHAMDPPPLDPNDAKLCHTDNCVGQYVPECDQSQQCKND